MTKPTEDHYELKYSNYIFKQLHVIINYPLEMRNTCRDT